MVKFELLLSASSLTCFTLDDQSAALLKAQPGTHISSLLADGSEFFDLKSQVKNLVFDSEANPRAFCTLNLVFRAPGAATQSPLVDRTPIEGVFRSPIRAIHMSNEQQLSCLVHIEMATQDPHVIHLTAVEFSRKYRQNMLREEFGSWLLEDHIEQAVIATDPVGKVVFWNRFASELYQYGKLEAIGGNIVELISSEMTQEMGVEIFSRLIKGEHWKGLFGVQRKDKSRFMAHVIDTPVLDQQGQLKFVVGVSDDYTPMHDLMDKLKNLNANLEQEVELRTKALLDRERSLRMVGAAVNESDTGVIIVNEEFRIIWSNEASQNFLQLSHDEMITIHPWNLPLDYRPHSSADDDNHNAAGDETTKLVRDFFESSRPPTPMKAFAKSPDGESENRRFLSISVQAMTDSHNRMIVLRDQTAERQAEEERRRAEKEAAASRSKTEMMQMLSHEFRTPLQGIMGVVSTILMDMEEDASLHESLSTIAASSRLLLTLINNILDLGKMDADKMQTVELSPVSLQCCIQDAVTFCEPFAKLNDCDLVIQLPTQDVNTTGRPFKLPDAMVVANKLRVEQILINLTSNAIKYGGEGKQVQIGVRLCSKKDAISEALNAGASDLKMRPREDTEASLANDTPVVIVTVRDQGRGIPEGEFEALFGEFNQLAISKEKDSKRKRKAHAIGQSSGSGLGLNLVLKFVTLMNGHVWVTNCPAEGAEFHFCFPQADIQTPLPPKLELVPAQKSVLRFSNLESELGSLRVMLLDDSIINLKVLKRMLVRLGVKHVQIFTDGTKALATLRRTKSPAFLPNLIMSDLEMPAMGGFDFLRQLRKEALHLPTVMACSADWSPETEQRCLAEGFDGFLRKPIILSALHEYLVSNYVCRNNEVNPHDRDQDLLLLESNFSFVQAPNRNEKSLGLENYVGQISLACAINTDDMNMEIHPTADISSNRCSASPMHPFAA